MLLLFIIGIRSFHPLNIAIDAFFANFWKIQSSAKITYILQKIVDTLYAKITFIIEKFTIVRLKLNEIRKVMASQMIFRAN